MEIFLHILHLGSRYLLLWSHIFHKSSGQVISTTMLWVLITLDHPIQSRSNGGWPYCVSQTEDILVLTYCPYPTDARGGSG